MATVQRKAHPRDLGDKVVPVREAVYEDDRVVATEQQKLKHHAMKSATTDMATMVDDSVKKKPKAIVVLRQSVEDLDVFLKHQDNPSPETYQAVLGAVGKIRRSMEVLAPTIAKMPPAYQKHLIGQFRQLDSIINNVILGDNLDNPLAIQEIDEETYDRKADEIIDEIKRAKDIVADCDATIDEISGETQKKVHEKMKPSFLLRFLRGKSPFLAGLYSATRYGYYFLAGLMGRTAPQKPKNVELKESSVQPKPKLNTIKE